MSKKLAASEKAAHRRKSAAALRASLKKSALALEQSRREHQQAELVAAQLEEDAVAEHLEADSYLPGVSDPEDALLATPPKKVSFWERVVGWLLR
jgi:hypothetical protein